MAAEEKYEFKSGTKKTLLILGVVGLVLFALGVFQASRPAHHEEKKASAAIENKLVASNDDHAAADGAKAESHEEEGGVWPMVMKRIKTSLWHNNVYFTGLGIIGLFFIAIQYAAQAGWSAPIKRIPLAIGHWIPIAGILTLGIWFFSNHDLFHWTHSYLYDKAGGHYDKALDGKGGFFFWPLAHGSFPAFYVIRMVVFFGLWFLFFNLIKKHMLAEDLEGGTSHWLKIRKFAAIFLIIFAVSSSVSAWDWVMSIDPHWFSTMNGWYVFASWWVSGLALITLLVTFLKDAGYLKQVNANHLHDLGKFIFGFSIFWTYIWFSQYLLIFYANIPEETVYFIQRRSVSPYSWVFFTNLILNFVLPFLLLMPRDAKRQLSTLKVVCVIVLVGHWFDFYNMITPGVMQFHGGLGFLEIGLGLVFISAFLYVVLNSLSKFPLVAKQHPMMEESMHHHI
ncbi:MAG: quinol:cytochrome C oxidoreductase [Cyclobacteriaceae bacterium]